MKALIIDDEVEICFLLSSILRANKWTTCFANSLEEGMELLIAENPQWIFLDNNLPDGKGATFIPLIRQYDPHITIVMITAFDTLDDREDAIRKGAHYYLPKPFSRENILSILERRA